MCIILNTCCYCLPLEIGVIILAILHGIWAVYYTLDGIYYMRNERIVMTLFAFGIVILSVVLLVCVILGMIQKKARLILFALFAGVIFIAIGILYFILYFVFPTSDDEKLVVSIVVFIILYSLYVYLLIVMNSYRVDLGGESSL